MIIYKTLNQLKVEVPDIENFFPWTKDIFDHPETVINVLNVIERHYKSEVIFVGHHYFHGLLFYLRVSDESD